MAETEPVANNDAADGGAGAADGGRSSRRRTAVVVVAVVVLLGIAGLIWVAVTGLAARAQAARVERTAAALKQQMTAGNRPAAERLAARLRQQAAVLHHKTGGPAWWAFSEVPYLGGPLKSTREVSVLADEAATSVIPAAVDALRVVGPQPTSSTTSSGLGRRIDLAGLRSIAAPMQRAAAVAGDLRQQASRTSASTWLGPVNDKVATFRSDIDQLQRDTADLATASRLLPGQLGANGVQRYFVAFETEAEARGLGGLPGAYAILTADHGRLDFTGFGSDSQLAKARATVNLGAAFDNAYSLTFSPYRTFVNSDASPNFPDAAQIWLSMWQNLHHQRLDGAIALDPTALSYLLRTVGTVTLSDGTQLNSGNVVTFFEHTVYVKYPDALIPSINQARKSYQIAAARAIASAIVHEPLSQLVKAAGAISEAADQRRLLAYTMPGRTETYLAAHPGGGVLPVTTRPFVAVTVNNGSAKKLDYYLEQAVTYQRISCAAGTSAVTVTLTNTAPASGLPPIIAGEHAKQGTPAYARSNLIVSLFSTSHSTVTRTTVNGHQGFVSSGSENGHPMTLTSVSIPPGKTATLVFTVREPAATGATLAVPQPAVNPVSMSIHAPACG